MLVATKTHDRSTRNRAWQCSGTCFADYVVRVGRILHAQGDAQVGIGANVITDNPVRTLRCQHQMHTKTAPALRNTEQGSDERRLLHRKRGELVDHHNKSGETRQHWLSRAYRSI